MYASAECAYARVPALVRARSRVRSAARTAPMACLEVYNIAADAISNEHMRALHGCVLEQAFDAIGCRIVQRALDVGDDAGRTQIAKELRGHVCQAIESPHANCVLQRVIEMMRPSPTRFVLDEIEPYPDSPGTAADVVSLSGSLSISRRKCWPPTVPN